MGHLPCKKVRNPTPVTELGGIPFIIYRTRVCCFVDKMRVGKRISGQLADFAWTMAKSPLIHQEIVNICRIWATMVISDMAACRGRRPRKSGRHRRS
jgi:hypothetical protein